MRVSTAYQFDSYSSQIQNAYRRYFDAQKQVMSGKRIETLSDGPTGGSMLMSLRGIKAATTQYDSNLTTGKLTLAQSEAAISDVVSILNRAYQLALQGANSSTSQEGRDGMVTEIVTLQQRFVDLSNQKGSSGQYIFAGQKTAALPFTVAGGVLTYNGDANPIRIETGPSQTMAINSLVGGAFTQTYSALESLKANLSGGNEGAISGVDLPALQIRLGEMRMEQGAIGAKLSSLNDLRAFNQRRIDELTARKSDIEDVDMSQAIVAYKSAETAYTSALQTASMGFGLSLLNFLR